MIGISSILAWFTGGTDRPYMTLDHCMVRDWLWIGITVGLDLSVAAGYLVIAYHWWRNQQGLDRKNPARLALGRLRNIFLFCGLCGYMFIPIKVVWPAWRLYDLFMIVLVYTTWRYAWNTKDLRVVYQELHKTHQLSRDLEQSREESHRKSLFLNAISHDLKTPLNGVSLQAELALMTLEGKNLDPEAARAAVSEIRTLTHCVARLLDEFLELGRLDWSEESIHPSRFPISELLDDVLARIRNIPEAQKLDVRVDEVPDIVLSTDRVKLDRILQNLIQNAVKFTPSGHVLVRVHQDSQHLEIEVEDTGIGIAENFRDNLFDEFYQVNNRERDRSKGFGLGLAIARRLARRLGGDLQVESSLGNGSRFFLILPVSVVQGRAEVAASDDLGITLHAPPGPDCGG